MFKDCRNFAGEFGAGHGGVPTVVAAVISVETNIRRVVGCPK
jgi:hypothetical protein